MIYVFLLALMAGFAVFNALCLKRLLSCERVELQDLPRVSLLVPARDEQANLERLLLSLNVQDYENLEIIVLDDHSVDFTLEILMKASLSMLRLRVVQGADLPAGWLGKNWACSQLAHVATGEILVFTDADTDWQPNGVRLIVQTLVRTGADALSAWPQHPTSGWFSSLVQPVQQWSLLAFLPMFLVRVATFPVAVAAIGQLMVFRRAAYDAIGGHLAVRGNVIEDMALARNVKKAGLHFELLSAVGTVSCRMYQTTREVWDGFSKNVYPGAGATPASMLILIVVVWSVGVVPWVWLIVNVGLRSSILEPFTAVLLSLIPRLLSDWRYGYPSGRAVLHPLSVLCWTAIAFESWRRYVTGRVAWKGRYYDLRNDKNAVPDEVFKL